MPISRDLARRATPVLAAVGIVALVGLRVVRARNAAREEAPRPPESFTVPLPSMGNEASPFELDGTHIRVRKADGSFARDADLVGAVLDAGEPGGVKKGFRIDTVEPDPQDRSGEIVLYGLSVRDASGAWIPACKPDARGAQRAFPIAGVWTTTGVHVPSPGRFEMACTSGAYGRCVRLGYKPWKGREMWDRHQACTRLLRADYCGDGVSHTGDDAPIHVFDAAGIQPDAAAPGMQFEAGWGVDGAVCVSKSRAPALFSLDDVRASCPARLQVVGEACTEDRARRDPRALLFNKS